MVNATLLMLICGVTARAADPCVALTRKAPLLRSTQNVAGNEAVAAPAPGGVMAIAPEPVTHACPATTIVLQAPAGVAVFAMLIEEIVADRPWPGFHDPNGAVELPAVTLHVSAPL